MQMCTRFVANQITQPKTYLKKMQHQSSDNCNYMSRCTAKKNPFGNLVYSFVFPNFTNISLRFVSTPLKMTASLQEPKIKTHQARNTFLVFINKSVLKSYFE